MASPSNNLIDSNMPATKAAAVTPHDSTNLASLTRSLYIGGDGNIVCVFPDGDAITFSNVVAGTILPVRVKRVNSTNTTATNIVALY